MGRGDEVTGRKCRLRPFGEIWAQQLVPRYEAEAVGEREGKGSVGNGGERKGQLNRFFHYNRHYDVDKRNKSQARVLYTLRVLGRVEKIGKKVPKGN